MYFHTVRCPLRATGASPSQGRVVPRGAPGPVGAEGFRDVRNETGKTVPRCFVKLISDLSEADRSEIQLDVLDLPFVLVGFGSSVCVHPGREGSRSRNQWAASRKTPRKRFECADSSGEKTVCWTFVIGRGAPVGVHRVLMKLYDSVGDSWVACLEFNNIKGASMRASGCAPCTLYII